MYFYELIIPFWWQERYFDIITIRPWARMQLSLLSSESGAAQTKGQLPGQASECSPRVGFRCRLSYSVHTAPVCVHICSQVHNPKHQQQHCLAAQRYSSHCPNLHRQNVAAQVVGELETVTYIFVSGEKMGILKKFFFFYCLCGWGKEDCRRRRRRINLWHMHTSTWSFSETCMQLGVYLYTEQYLSLAWWKTLHDRLHILCNAQFNFE